MIKNYTPIYASLLILFISSFSFSQDTKWIHGIVKDQFENPLSNAEIFDESDSLVASTDSLGAFIVKVDLPMTFYAKHELDFSESIKIKTKSANLVIFTIVKKIQLMNEVFVTRGNTQTVFDENAVNVVDYIPFENNLLTLKKYKGDYFIGYDEIGKEGESYLLDIKAKGLYQDCLDNYYVFSNDSAYHISIKNDGLHYMNILSIKDFTNRLKNCVVKSSDYLVTEEIHSLRTGYSLKYIKNDTNFIAYSFVDSVRLKYVVNAYYGNYRLILDRNGAEGQAALLQIKREYEKKYNMRIYDDRLVSPRNKGRRDDSYGEHRTRSKTIPNNNDNNNYRDYGLNRLVGNNQEVFTFKLKTGFVVINTNDNSANIFNEKGEAVRTRKVSLQGKFEFIFQDGKSSNLYFLMKEGGNHKVYAYNPLTGEVIYAKNFKTFPNTSNVKVYDGWLYFKYLKNNYYDIKRVRLPEFED